MARLSNVGSAFARNPAIKKAGAIGASPSPAGPVKGLPAQGPAKGVVRPPAGAAPLAGAPSASPPPMPWDANYDSTIGGINRNQTSDLAGLANEETGVKQAYGFDDLSNPFSKLALLKERFANSQRGDTNSMAAAGQLYSGAMENQKADTQHGQDIDYDALRRAYETDLGDIATRRTGVTNTAADATTAAGWERTQTALANRPDPASVPEPTAAGATPKVTPGKNSKGEPGSWHEYPPSLQYPTGRKVFVKG